MRLPQSREPGSSVATCLSLEPSLDDTQKHGRLRGPSAGEAEESSGRSHPSQAVLHSARPLGFNGVLCTPLSRTMLGLFLLSPRFLGADLTPLLPEARGHGHVTLGWTGVGLTKKGAVIPRPHCHWPFVFICVYFALWCPQVS